MLKRINTHHLKSTNDHNEVKTNVFDTRQFAQ